MFRRVATSCVFTALLLPAAARTRPRYGGAIRVEVAGDPLASPGGLARRLIFDGLTEFGPDGSVQPALAIAWQADDRDHRWQFTLRPGVSFQDGSPVTGPAVVESLNRSCNGDCPWSAVHAVGSSLIFTGGSPMPQLPALLAGDEFLIGLTTGADGLPPANPTGTGPFQFVSNSSDAVMLAANQHCWQGRPFADSVEIRGHRGVRQQWLDLSVDRADVVEVPPEMLREAHQQQLNLVTSPPVTLLALQLASGGALANPKLRASIAEAVDRGALFNVIFQKQGEFTAALLPQQMTGYAFLFPTDRKLSKAIALRGGLSPTPLKLAVKGDSAMQLAAQRIALNLRDAGFQVQVVSGDAGMSDPVAGQSPATLYHAEKEILDSHVIVPLLDLPRAWAVGAHVRDFALRADGTPDLANASLEGAP